ncbi:hypothetical protein Cadr_000002763 [Camelus dromedarius]|uniref:Uncharacterized protein n=1 Tax=Camelus dromedarius TaxID=9838 RepID=A0A5N4C342_CAMDR|nr:hypothetical protein Cadr_000002763 [Camelus dromedarius]
MGLFSSSQHTRAASCSTHKSQHPSQSLYLSLQQVPFMFPAPHVASLPLGQSWERENSLGYTHSIGRMWAIS